MIDWNYWGQILGVVIPVLTGIWALHRRMEQHHREDYARMFDLWKENEDLLEELSAKSDLPSFLEKIDSASMLQKEMRISPFLLLWRWKRPSRFLREIFPSNPPRLKAIEVCPEESFSSRIALNLFALKRHRLT